ncbi:signal transduction histidine kinase [Kibdelosporangium banguiense]|uniref:histidine kinase n=1 Tax=Kibdelosporangium banguiense TaxID=1365924 RepID=A0ABS4T895_9PSEU|nr:sensor domain-containing protein [Kibdelosporangium banguiense]MBP2320541.1 signal transduction histidine kinase [Kibdelosporangium banguiense]
MTTEVQQVDGRRHQPGAVGANVYLFVGFFTATFAFWLPLALLLAGFGTAVVWVGFPILTLAMVLCRGFARVERRLVHATLGFYIANPYRPLPRGPVGWFKGRFTDPATWRDFLYSAIVWPISLVSFVLFTVFWAVGLGFATLPFWYRFVDGGFMIIGDIRGPMYVVDSFDDTLIPAVVGFMLLCLAYVATKWVGKVRGLMARSLLGPSKTSMLAAEAAHLQASRARGVDAAEAERRRIERDLHDGAQQRLVAVAMGLGRAKNKMNRDPEAAMALIDEAHSDAKKAVAELRDLARGIYPAVLGDRGLDAALSSLAAKAPIPVDVTVEDGLSSTNRPPAAVESTAYFTVAESLTNIAKYSGATQAGVRVYRERDHVIVEITDDGMGGAQIRSGGGLAGLADRAATIDGVLTVVSPVGGPTVIRADLPCEW